MLKLAIGLLIADVWALHAGPAQPPGFTLPDTVHPTRYTLDLSILPEEPNFSGTVRIHLTFDIPTSVFWLNAKDLQILNATLEAPGSSTPLRILAGSKELVGFEASQPIPAGNALVTIAYTGLLDKDKNVGAFRRRFDDDWYVFTTFTPIEARRAFPCLDEPRFKVPWELTLHVKQSQVALGNSPMLSETNEPGGMKKVEFAPTLPLPSEVVAFAVGPFETVDAGSAGLHHIPVRIITPKGQAANAAAARSATPEILERLEAYTGIPYPWHKLDHIALAGGAYGAVENPGLITYQEGLLLAKPSRDTPERVHQMRSVMAHELAHQWFGNLVTQASWQDVWLSEGFATWLSAKIMDVEYPPFERGSPNHRMRAIAAEAPDRKWPVRRTIDSRAAAENVYNGLVYSKAAAVLDTLETWLGEAAMQRGLQNYLEAYSFKNATTDNLAEALKSQSGEDVSPVLHSLLDHPGLPVLQASVKCARLDLEPASWVLPVCAHWDGGGHQCRVIQPGQTNLEFNTQSCPAWLWTNASGRGYYRFRLSPANLESIVQTGYGQLTTPERRSLLSDLGAMLAEGRIAPGTAMKILTTTARDSEPSVALESMRIAAALGPLVPGPLKVQYSAWLKQTFGVPLTGSRSASSIGRFLLERNANAAKKPRPAP